MDTIDDVMKLANELGLMIKRTEIFREYEELSARVKADPETTRIIDEFEYLAEDIYNREKAGMIIESYEKENLKDLFSYITQDELLSGYLEKKKKYIELLSEIQKSIEEDLSSE